MLGFVSPEALAPAPDPEDCIAFESYESPATTFAAPPPDSFCATTTMVDVLPIGTSGGLLYITRVTSDEM